MTCETTVREEGSWMYAREFLESGNAIKANPAIAVLRTTRRFLLFLFVLLLYASKMIMRPERESEEPLDPCPGQTDCRYGAEPLRESGPATENAVPHRRAATQTCCGDDYASRPVARYARAIQCGWRRDHRQAYTPRISAPGTR